MYQKKSKGWYKHKDFIFIDLMCISLAFLLADWIRNGTIRNLYQNDIYRNTAIFLLLMDLCVCVIFESYKGVLRRGYYLEFNAVVKQTIILELVQENRNYQELVSLADTAGIRVFCLKAGDEIRYGNTLCFISSAS